MKTEIWFEHTALASHNRYVHAGLSKVTVKIKEKLSATNWFLLNFILYTFILSSSVLVTLSGARIHVNPAISKCLLNIEE